MSDEGVWAPSWQQARGAAFIAVDLRVPLWFIEAVVGGSKGKKGPAQREACVSIFMQTRTVGSGGEWTGSSALPDCGARVNSEAKSE